MPFTTKSAYYAAAIFTLLLTACSDRTPSYAISSAQLTEARKLIEDQAKRNVAEHTPRQLVIFSRGMSPINTINITPSRITIFTANPIGSEGNSFVFPIKKLKPGSTCDNLSCLVSLYHSGSLYGSSYVDYAFYLPKNDVKNAPEKVHDLANALLILQKAAQQPRSTDPQFQKVVSDYLAASPKPVLSEAAQRLSVQADEAAKNKQLANAIDDYLEALELAPWWPQGHYNLALDLAESKEYDGAIDEMKCYLMLAPDGSDAQTAKDKISHWQNNGTGEKWYQF